MNHHIQSSNATTVTASVASTTDDNAQGGWQFFNLAGIVEEDMTKSIILDSSSSVQPMTICRYVKTESCDITTELFRVLLTSRFERAIFHVTSKFCHDVTTKHVSVPYGRSIEQT